MNLELYIGMTIAGLFTGLGSAVGNYLAQKHLVNSLEKVVKKINGKTNDK